MNLNEVKVKDLMAVPVISVSSNDLIQKVADKILKSKVSGVVVLDKEKPLGIIYSTDLVKYIFLPENSRNITAYEVVKKQENIVLEEDTPLKEALEIMLKKGKKKLPVVDKNGDILGVFSIVDAMKYILSIL